MRIKVVVLLHLLLLRIALKFCTYMYCSPAGTLMGIESRSSGGSRIVAVSVATSNLIACYSVLEMVGTW